MNRSQRKFVREVNESFARHQDNRFKSRGGRPSVVHESEPVRDKSVPVLVGRGSRVNEDDYIDYE